MERLPNVATPPTAATVALPESVPLPGLLPIASVILPENPVAVLPLPARAVTVTAGEIVAPAVAVVGCCVHTSWLAAARVPLDAVEAAPLMPGAVVPVRPVAWARSG